MAEIGHFKKYDDRFEFHYPELGLVVRGNYAEWVLEAAAEIISTTEKLRSDSTVEELRTLAEFGETSEIEIDVALDEMRARFEVVPQCVVSMGSMDYKWTSASGRTPGETSINAGLMRRVHDMSLTRGGTFLANRDGVVTSEP